MMPKQPKKILISRREFLSGVAVCGGLVAAFGDTSTLSIEPSVIETTHINIAVSNLSPSLEGLKIAFVSDIHLGPFLPRTWLEHIASEVRREKVDLLLLGGDYVWIGRPALFDLYAQFMNRDYAGMRKQELREATFADVPRLLSNANPRLGQFAIYGNHDRWEGSKLCSMNMKQHDFKMLVNETISMQSGGGAVEVIGVDDYWTGVPTLPKLSAKAPGTLRILLAHNPDYVAALIRRKALDFDLALCGHTHGGQIRLPKLFGNGAIKLNVEDRRYGCGYANIDGYQVYTTRGIGTVEIPIRINCPPELSIITIVA